MSTHPSPVGQTGRPWRYSRTAIVLHWTIALALPLLAGLGWYMLAVEKDPGSARLFDWHKSFGVLAGLLIAARVAWRLTHRPAPLPGSVPKWQTTLAGVSHALLYLSLVAMPVTGYLGASYSKQGVQVFGWPTPRWAAPDHDLAEKLFAIHGVLIWVLVALVAAHIAGALKHLLADRDGVFQRMW